MPTTPALLALENGQTFSGFAFGDITAEASGEVVFNTALTGYQEVLTDPSYRGQILTFTYPHIGNYGITHDDGESTRMQAEGLIVREYARLHSNWRAVQSLEEYLKEQQRIGIQGIDTRSLVRILRSEGVMRGIVSAKELQADALVERARALPSMEGTDLTRFVTTQSMYTFAPHLEQLPLGTGTFVSPRRFRVATIDYGIKQNILRRLAEYNCEVVVFPSNATADDIRAIRPDGLFLSNGPGDPSAVTYTIDTIRTLVQELPTFGICLGHQLLALAFGASTYKLRFGHRGANHPVKNHLLNHIEITSQNHGFGVEQTSMPDFLELTHTNLNDHSVAGFRHKTLPVFCVQYHPEASPGTHDSDYLFRQFIALMETRTSDVLTAQI